MNEMRRLMETVQESLGGDVALEARRIARETIERCDAGLDAGSEDMARESLIEIREEMIEFAKWLGSF